MPGPAIILAIDVPNRRFVVSNGSLPVFDSLPRGVYPARIYLRTLDDNSLPGFGGSATKKFDITGYDGIRVGLWQAMPGTDENELTLTDQTGWRYSTEDVDNPYWYGNINTATPLIKDWIGSESCKDCFLCISLVTGADVAPILDLQECGVANFEIKNQIDPGSGMGVDMTGNVPRLPLPCILGPDANNKMWSIDGVSGDPPAVNITCLNP